MLQPRNRMRDDEDEDEEDENDSVMEGSIDAEEYAEQVRYTFLLTCRSLLNSIVHQ